MKTARNTIASLEGGSFNMVKGNHGLPEQADATAHPLVMLAATMLATDWFCKTTCAKKKTRKLSLLAMRPADRGDWPTTPMQQVPLGSHSLFAVRDMLKSSKHPDEWTWSNHTTFAFAFSFNHFHLPTTR